MLTLLNLKFKPNNKCHLADIKDFYLPNINLSLSIFTLFTNGKFISLNSALYHWIFFKCIITLKFLLRIWP